MNGDKFSKGAHEEKEGSRVKFSITYEPGDFGKLPQLLEPQFLHL